MGGFRGALKMPMQQCNTELVENLLHTAKWLFKCCNYCIVALLVVGGSTQRDTLSVAAGTGCPKTIAHMLDQGAWPRMADHGRNVEFEGCCRYFCRGCRRSAATLDLGQ